jgi:hypothetical protein
MGGLLRQQGSQDSRLGPLQCPVLPKKQTSDTNVGVRGRLELQHAPGRRSVHTVRKWTVDLHSSSSSSGGSGGAGGGGGGGSGDGAGGGSGGELQLLLRQQRRRAAAVAVATGEEQWTAGRGIDRQHY